MRRALLLALAAAGCAGDLDPRWQLDHDRVIAVRATPPAIPAGGAAGLDALLAHAGGPTTVERPVAAQLVEAPPALAGVLAQGPDGWEVRAPDDATLAAVRAELALAADAPVNVRVGVAFPGPGGQPLLATKIVSLGARADNPAVPPVTVGGAPLVAPVELPAEGETTVAVEVPAETEVNWLTSAASLRDDDEPTARLRVEDGDALEGELAVVVRDARGGVAWQVWPIRVR